MSDLLREAFVGSRRLSDPDLSAQAHRRARVAQGMLALYGVALIGSVAWSWAFPFTPALTTEVAIGVVFVLAAVAFASWQVSAYRLVPALSGAPAEHATWWAAAGYVVPVLNLFRPFQIMAEIRDATDPAGLDAGLERVGPAVPLGVWWALWLTAGISERVFLRVPEPGPSDDWTAYQIGAVAVIALWLGATLAAIAVIRQIDAGQREVEAVLADAPRVAA